MDEDDEGGEEDHDMEGGSGGECDGSPVIKNKAVSEEADDEGEKDGEGEGEGDGEGGEGAEGGEGGEGGDDEGIH